MKFNVMNAAWRSTLILIYIISCFGFYSHDYFLGFTFFLAGFLASLIETAEDSEEKRKK